MATNNSAVWNEAVWNNSVWNAPGGPPPPPPPNPCAKPDLPGPLFADMVAELVGTVPHLSALHAAQLINRAWARIRDFRLWSFHQVADAQLFCPDGVTTGTVTVTFDSNQIVGDADAATVWDTLVEANPPLSCPILGIGRQIRLGSTNGLSSPTGPIYSIMDYDGIDTLTIDRPFGEFSTTLAPYQIFKCYYSPPAPQPFTDPRPDLRFVRYMSITNKNNGYTIFGPNLYWSQMQLNAIDPQRGGQGDAYIVANYGRNGYGYPIIELYPNPVKFTTYYCTYYSRWMDLSSTVRLPAVSYELPDTIMAWSKKLASEFALANVVTYPELGQTNWVAYQQMQMAEYKLGLINCCKQDDELCPLIPFRQGQGYMFPLGGQFLQSHDITSVLPRGY